ncbi:MAG: hypothetical protein Q9195_000154 [Heterodermia aff. obscurata]
MAQPALGNSFLGRFTPGSSNNIKLFEIRLEENPLFLRGSPDVAAGVVLKGTLVLCLSAPLQSIRSVRLRFVGEKRLKFIDLSPSCGHVSWHKTERRFAHASWNFVKRDRDVLETGNHEWDFELRFPGNSLESIEGFSEGWIIYRMKGTIERGFMQKDEITRKNVRVVRTLDPADLGSTLEMSIANVWTNKIVYSMSTPHKAIAFGTVIEVNFSLSPLLKGLRIEQVITRLKEDQQVKLDEKGRPPGQWRYTRTVAEDKYLVPVDIETQDTSIEGISREGYILSRNLEMPKNLKDCLQSVAQTGFRIKHYLDFNLQLRNPDGHLSEVSNISQHSRALLSEVTNVLAPPTYGQHQFDQLYSSFDQTGYDTPARASGSVTPHSPGSRSASNDNLTSMDGIASNSVTANALQNRLNELDVAGESETSATGDDEGPARRQVRFTLPSRRTSEEDALPSGIQTPREPLHIEDINDDLSRVPSYSTALQSRPNVPLDNALPTYQTAVATPERSTPVRWPSGQSYAPARPSHLGSATTSSEEAAC